MARQHHRTRSPAHREARPAHGRGLHPSAGGRRARVSPATDPPDARSIPGGLAAPARTRLRRDRPDHLRRPPARSEVAQRRRAPRPPAADGDRRREAGGLPPALTLRQGLPAPLRGHPGGVPRRRPSRRDRSRSGDASRSRPLEAEQRRRAEVRPYSNPNSAGAFWPDAAGGVRGADGVVGADRAPALAARADAPNDEDDAGAEPFAPPAPSKPNSSLA